MESLLELKKINKTYPDFHLDINNINIKTGEIIGLIGENGSGKTTILESIKFFPYENNISLCGKRLKGEDGDVALLKIWVIFMVI